MTRTIVVTGCDANHFDLATDLMTSLRDQRGRDVTIGFVHVGDDPLPPEMAALADQVAHVPDSDFPAANLRGFRLAYLGVKPRIPELFPGYDVYIWLDGDTWVQNAVGLDQLTRLSAGADICMHPELDPNYYAKDYSHEYMLNVYNSIYGREIADQFGRRFMLNSGVFSARADSPVWDRWRRELTAMFERSKAGFDVHFSDQIPLHKLIMSEAISVLPLRAVNNWLAALCLPALNPDSGRLFAPSFPFEEINIIHLVASSKHKAFNLGGDRGVTTLRYRDIRRLVQHNGPKADA